MQKVSPQKPLKRLFRLLGKCLLAFLAATGLYVGSAWLAMFVPVNSNAPQQGPIAIYVQSNGVHTDLLLPLAAEGISWQHLLDDFPQVSPSSEAYLAFGLGERAFYIHTPAWEDLSPSVAFKALFWPTASAMHVTYYAQAPSPNSRCHRLLINQAQYKALSAYIQASFGKKAILIRNAGYGSRDNFYEAPHAYHLFYTCNDWTNQALRQAGLRAALWSPFDWGILYQTSPQYHPSVK
jgi:uncharacterized protein (TIGR02117 family)